MLLASLERVALVALPAFDGLANGFGALRRVLPVLALRIALRAYAGNGVCLLFQRVVEPSQKHLVVASGRGAHAGLRAHGKVVDISVAIGFEIGELLFVFEDAALRYREGF